MNRHYHDFSRFSFFGLPVTRWECSCGIKTRRRKNVNLLQNTTQLELGHLPDTSVVGRIKDGDLDPYLEHINLALIKRWGRLRQDEVREERY